MIRFLDPKFFVLILAIAGVLWMYFRRKQRPGIRFSDLRAVQGIRPSFWMRSRHVLIVLRVVCLTLLMLGLMRPQAGIEESKVETEGIDIVLAIDVSGSMMAEDFELNGQRQNRLEVVKSAVREFIKKRHNDRIGIVLFAGRAYVQAPLTLDYAALLEFLERAEIGMIEDGTAIGDGLTMALSRLRKIESKSKIVILLSDGANNAGEVDPIGASELAKAIGVKVYTIGAGSNGKVPFPARDMFGNKVYRWGVIEIDETALQKMADNTGGKYFRAYDTNGLEGIYDAIDKLEKTKMEVDVYSDYKELFPGLALTALALLLAELALRNTRYRTLP